MSANSYSQCPKCLSSLRRDLVDLEALMEQGYGTIERAIFKQMEEKLTHLKERLSQADYNLGEYYEFFIPEDENVIVVDYGGECRECGFKVSFTHRHPFNISQSE